MSEAVVAGYKGPESRSESVTLPARPEPITLKPSETAVVVVDMQNAYSTEGGYVDLAGFDISGAKGTIANIKKTLDAARAAGVQVIYFQNGWDKDYVEAGGPGSPNWHKSNALKTMRKRPELQGQLLAKGTWDYAIVDELQPQPGDILVPKTRYSGSSTPIWTAFCVPAASAIWSSSASPPMSVSKARYATLSISNISG